MKKTMPHVPEMLFGKMDSSRRPVTVESLPTSAEIWNLLRGAYGANLIGATLIAVVNNDGGCTVQTITFPGDAK